MPTPTPTDIKPGLYSPISDVETPAVLVDLDAMERNVLRYVDFAEEHDVALRSHVKTHKTPQIAHYQHRLTGDGILCQTLSEAEVMAQAGIDDIYLSYMVVGERKLDRLVRLSETVSRFATTVDGPGNIDPLQDAAASHDTTIGAVLEIDIGYGRTGAQPETAVDLAQTLVDLSNVEFRGIMAYEAHIKREAETRREYEQLCAEAMDGVADIVSDIRDAGVDVPEVKVGGTATARFRGTHPVVPEINPGMYPFNDVGELRVRPFEVKKADCAVTVLTTVISKPTEDRAVVDAGSKSIARDSSQEPVPKSDDHEDVHYYRSSEEHGWVDTSNCDADISVGDRLEFIVPHVCTTINLHDQLVGVRNGRVEELWNVQGRGKVT